MNRHVPLGSADLVTSVLLLFGVWLGLPSRWWPVDLGGTTVAAAFFVVGIGLVTGKHWARAAARVVSWVVLLSGLGLLTALVWTLTYLMALYGPVGKGGALILATVAALLLPYLVVLPAAHLMALRSAPRQGVI